jgi:hypothetical protein
MAAIILKFDIESGGREIPAANLFDGRMGIKAFKGLRSCAGGGVEGEYRPAKPKLQPEAFPARRSSP